MHPENAYEAGTLNPSDVFGGLSKPGITFLRGTRR